MKVITFNIQHCLDYQKNIINFDLFIKAIKDFGADICGLNEVRGDGPLPGYTDQTKTLSDGLGCSGYFGEAIKVDGTSPYGNALLCTLPLKSAQTLPIPDPEDRDEEGRFETRSIIKAVINADGRDICVLVLHMGLEESERKNAVSTLCGLIDSIKLPLIVMGDFNTEPHDEILKPLFERLKDTDEMLSPKKNKTYPSDKPQVKIDYMLYRGLTLKKVSVPEKIFSDHRPVIAEFSF